MEDLAIYISGIALAISTLALIESIVTYIKLKGLRK